MILKKVLLGRRKDKEDNYGRKKMLTNLLFSPKLTKNS